METLRAFFHMGRVECVTCQVPRSQERGGGVNDTAALEREAAAAAAVVVGERRVTIGWGVEALGPEDDMPLEGKGLRYRKNWEIYARDVDCCEVMQMQGPR